MNFNGDDLQIDHHLLNLNMKKLWSFTKLPGAHQNVYHRLIHSNNLGTATAATFQPLAWVKTTFLVLILASFGYHAVGESVSASMNLLPQGDFKNPGISTAWAEGFNIPQNQEFQVISENGHSRLRIENHDAGRQLDYVHAYVRITPEIESLTVAVRMKATNLKVGAEGWHDARIAMSFEGSASGYPPQVPELTADSDWVTKSVDLKVPKGATRLNLQPAMFHCTGVFEIADLTVTPHLAMTTQLADARLPAGMDLNWEKLNYVDGGVTANPKRSQVCMDGIWRFIPAVEGAAEPPKVGWAYLKVPGSWQQRTRGRNTDFVAHGGGPQWDLFDGSRVARAWYQRQVLIPAEWQGRVISLRFDQVCTDAIIYVNGTQCGKVPWPWGSVDITSAVKPGQPADVRVLVAAIADAEQVGTFWQNALSSTVTFSSSTLRSRGLTGSVFLESRSCEARVTDVFCEYIHSKKGNLPGRGVDWHETRWPSASRR